MNTDPLIFCGHRLEPLPSGALYWPEQALLVVSDLHLGKAARQSRWGGAPLPPYEVRETLTRLATDLDKTGARHVIALGDSFDAPGLDACLPPRDTETLLQLQAGRDWNWIEGNHDPDPVSLPGRHLAQLSLDGLTFRHSATAERAEVSGHYHPKARLTLRGRLLARACFMVDDTRLILPAYGTYTGGLFTDSSTLSALMGPEAEVILTGQHMLRLPMPRHRPARRA